jgi:hypothetical protein
MNHRRLGLSASSCASGDAQVFAVDVENMYLVDVHLVSGCDLLFFKHTIRVYIFDIVKNRCNIIGHQPIAYLSRAIDPPFWAHYHLVLSGPLFFAMMKEWPKKEEPFHAPFTEAQGM